MSWLLLALFLVGNILAVLGWFFDRTIQITWLARVIIREYVDGSHALNDLAENPKRALLPSHPGFKVLLKYWPQLSDRQEPSFIGRSIAFTEFGNEVRNDIELIAMDKNLKHIEPRWRFSSARQELQTRANKTTFIFGTMIFFSGIAVSLVSGILEFLS